LDQFINDSKDACAVEHGFKNVHSNDRRFSTPPHTWASAAST
jgi:hypothetical protein